MSDSTQRLIEEATRENNLSLIIEAVAHRSAKAAVEETFFLLGVDLKDPLHVRSTRDVITHMRDQFQQRKNRADTWNRGIAHGVVLIITGGILAVFGWVVNTYAPMFHWKQ